MRTHKFYLISLFLLLLTIAIADTAYARLKTDSTKVRDVQISQQMVITEVSHIKGQKTIKYKAAIRGVFRVVSVDKDKAKIELDWALCPQQGCPVMATYFGGTNEYVHLDELIIQARKNEVKIKRLAMLAKSKPRINETYTDNL